MSEIPLFWGYLKKYPVFLIENGQRRVGDIGLYIRVGHTQIKNQFSQKTFWTVTFTEISNVKFEFQATLECFRNAWDTPKMGLGNAWDMQDICLKYDLDIFVMYLRYSWDIPKK